MKNSRKNSTKNVATNNAVADLQNENFVVADNIEQNEIVENIVENVQEQKEVAENVKEEQNEIAVIEKSNIEEKVVEKKVLIREKLRLYNTNNDAIFHNEKIVYDKKVFEFAKNSTFMQKLNLMKNSIKTESIDLHVLARFVACVTTFYTELKSETKEESIRELLFKYNVKKITSIEESKKVVLEYYEKFIKYDETKKTFSIQNIEEFLTNYEKSRVHVTEKHAYLKINRIINDFFCFAKSCSAFRSTNKDSLNLYNIIDTKETYNVVRNVNILTELKQILLESLRTDEEKKIFENETNLFYTDEIMQNNYNCNNAEKKIFHSLYEMQYEMFKLSENFSSEIEKLSTMTYFEQINYYVEKTLYIENFSDVIFYINKNYKKILMTA